MSTAKAIAGDALYSEVMVIPAVTVVLIALLAMAVLYHQVGRIIPPPSIRNPFDCSPGLYYTSWFTWLVLHSLVHLAGTALPRSNPNDFKFPRS